MISALYWPIWTIFFLDLLTGAGWPREWAAPVTALIVAGVENAIGWSAAYWVRRRAEDDE